MSSGAPRPNQPSEDSPEFALWQQRVQGTNISQRTLLATDYLNHFNEIIMLIGMVPDMPDILEECLSWAPKSYQDHFRDSGFSDKELAIAVYDHVPERYRRPFEDTIGLMNSLVVVGLRQLQGAVGEGDLAALAARAQASVQALQRALECASAIIHGAEHVLNQTEIDGLVGH